MVMKEGEEGLSSEDEEEFDLLLGEAELGVLDDESDLASSGDEAEEERDEGGIEGLWAAKRRGSAKLQPKVADNEELKNRKKRGKDEVENMGDGESATAHLEGEVKVGKRKGRQGEENGLDAAATAAAAKKKKKEKGHTEKKVVTTEGAAAVGPLSEATAKGLNWSDLHLSRPLLRAVVKLHWEHPTDIQLKSIPPALEGRDVLGTAETGSGKTGAFLLPILERLLNSPAVLSRRRTSVGMVGGLVATKALILLPTRELAGQCYEVLQSLIEFTAITCTYVSGGMDMKAQELSLRNQPDVVVATPGRILDLLMNSQTVNMELLEIVVFDEADKLLDLGFKDEW